MHKLIDYVCDELEEIERKAEKGGKLSTSDIQYADTLAHLKKNLLKSEMLEESDTEYSGARRRDAMGRYSSRGDLYINRRDNRYGYPSMSDGYSREDSKEIMKEELRDLEKMAKDDDTRHMIKKWIRQLEQG